MSRCAFLSLMVLLLGLQPAWGELSAQSSAGYHLERLQIQARAFLDTLEPLPVPTDTTASVAEQLELSTSNSTWSRQMVTDDVTRIVAAGQELSDQLEEATPDELVSARSTLESLARRLRVSSAALTLSAQSRTALDFLMLELEESSRVMDVQRAQILAQERAHRARRSLDVGFGFGYGYGYGGWGAPYGWGTYYPYGNPFGPGPYYSGYPRAYGIGPRGCR